MGAGTPRGALMIIGGGEDKVGAMEILREFVRISGGPEEARILTMTVASTDHAAQDEQYREAFGKLGVAHYRALETNSPEDVDDGKSLSALTWATGLFFTGGDQKRIKRILGKTRFERELHRRYDDGLILAGTSAGASIMSETMMDEGESQECPRVGIAKLGEGMGFLPGVIIDQHFSQRGRLGRLVAAVSEHPDELGIGIAEDTAILVRDGTFRVLGRGVATVIDASKSTYNDRAERRQDEAITFAGLLLHMIGGGNAFDLSTREFLPAADASEESAGRGGTRR